jgi:hypothetical protein
MSKRTPGGERRVPQTQAEPEQTRRRLADEYRKLAEGRRFTPAERAEFTRMADRWARTLPEKNTVK